MAQYGHNGTSGLTRKMHLYPNARIADPIMLGVFTSKQPNSEVHLLFTHNEDRSNSHHDGDGGVKIHRTMIVECFLLTDWPHPQYCRDPSIWGSLPRGGCNLKCQSGMGDVFEMSLDLWQGRPLTALLCQATALFPSVTQHLLHSFIVGAETRCAAAIPKNRDFQKWKFSFVHEFWQKDSPLQVDLYTNKKCKTRQV